MESQKCAMRRRRDTAAVACVGVAVTSLLFAAVWCSEPAARPTTKDPVRIADLAARAKSGETVARKLKSLIDDLRAHGCLLSSPNVTLSFITLIFIPDLAITDQGLFDVKAFRLIDPVLAVK